MASSKTAITFGLVNIPVKTNPIIKNNDTSFNYLHKKCLNRVSYIKYCPSCKKNVKTQDLIKGYEYSDDKYVTFDENDFEKLKTNEDKNINIISFIDNDEVDPIYFDKSYYLSVDKNNKAFSLFLGALKKCKKSAIAKTVIGNKSFYVLLRFKNNNIIMSTLYYEEEIRLSDDIIEEKYSEKEMNLALKLIESMEGNFEPSDYVDEYQNKVKNAIEKKMAGKEIKQSKSKRNVSVSNLMDALEKSLKRA